MPDNSTEPATTSNSLPSTEESERPAKRFRSGSEEHVVLREDSTTCIDCKKYYGHTDGKCSWCCIGKPPITGPPPEALSPEQIRRWIDTGFHAKDVTGACAVCLEHKTLDTNFCCACPPVTCEPCNSLITLCPSCQSGKYVRMSKDHLRSLLNHRFSNRSVIRIVRQLRQANTITEIPFSFQRLVCPVAEIDEVVRELNLDTTGEIAGQNCNILHTIYCFAPDFVQTQSNGALFIVCYKGMWSTRELPSYANIFQYKNQVADPRKGNLMDTVVSQND